MLAAEAEGLIMQCVGDADLVDTGSVTILKDLSY